MYTAEISLTLLVMLLVLMPRSARVLLLARLKRKGCVVWVVNDDGQMYPEIMQADKGQGIFEGKKQSYLILPRPPSENPIEVTDAENRPVDTDPVKKRLDKLVLSRCFMDVGKPVYIAYLSKSIAVPPQLLAHVEQATPSKAPTVGALLLDPRVLKIYFTKTFSPAILDSIRYVNREIGYYSRPELETVKRGIAIMVPLLILVAVAYLASTGQLDTILGRLTPT